MPYLSTFVEAVKLTVIRMQAGNFIGAMATLGSVYRLATKEGREMGTLMASEMECAILKKEATLPAPFTLPEIIWEDSLMDWELRMWDRGHEQELDQWSEQCAEHAYNPYYGIDADPKFNYSTYPEYLAPAVARQKAAEVAEAEAENGRQNAALAASHAEWEANGYIQPEGDGEDCPF